MPNYRSVCFLSGLFAKRFPNRTERARKKREKGEKERIERKTRKDRNGKERIEMAKKGL